MIKAPDVNWLAIAPEMALMIGAFVLLLLASFIRGRDRGIGTAVGLITLVVSAGFAINAWTEPATTTMAGAVQIDQLTQVVTVLIAGCGILTLLVSFGWNRMRENGAEFVALLLLVAAGMDLIAASNSFVTLFVALELFSLSLYVLCAFDGKSKASLESGFKYLVLGTIGSMVLVYGAAFLYGATGSFGFEAINTALSKAGSGDALVILGTVLVLIGLAFKIGVMPFHILPEMLWLLWLQFLILWQVRQRAEAVLFITRNLPYWSLWGLWQDVHWSSPLPST
ncbi:MAG: proton-conducting transporter membrane subunit [Verrucomicrobiota bacterium]